ncbi:unnamed protein product [Rangifer tarandus platyrhynchus]|uniref:Uncharacterized protein n=2 Tax=Rangifer tarandus platyrhynchus TaxID=3082113 RepID=A0ACB0F0D6_RANTA|nr:unnamed protein product [Rangifer tarandus platyrhynchus]CAI9705978.1 unnamed protein product [Rangifer tarandus platyrhynchus]
MTVYPHRQGRRSRSKTPAGLRAAAFCARGPTWPMGQETPRPGLAGCRAARLERTDPAGGGRRRQGDGGPREVRVGPGRPERRGRRRRTHPSTRRARGPPLGGDDRGSRGRLAGTPSPPHGLLSGPSPRNPQPTPGSLRPDTARPATPRARAPTPPSPPPLAPGEPSEETPAGRTLRKAWVTWGVAGGWAAFRAGGGRQDEEEEGGRSGRGAGAAGRGPGRQRAGRGAADAPAAVAVAAATAPAAPSGSSSGWSKMAALPAQGFLSPSQWVGPQKKGGGGCARSRRSPEEGGRRPACWPRPFPSPPLWTRRDAAEPAPLALAPEGEEAGTHAQAQSLALPLPGRYCAGSRRTC